MRLSPISQTELVRRLTTSVDSLAKAGQFSGVAVLAKSGVPIFQHAYGMADRERGVATNPETAFNLGSINKVLTQIAILQLRDAGKLDLDSTLSTYWPDYPNKEVARKITIRQLLRHTSGIGGNIFDVPAGGKRNDIRTLKDYLPLFVNEPMQFEPGTRNAYSNAGYVVLGLLIERLSGDDYYAYVRQHILQPAGMNAIVEGGLPGGYDLIVLANLDPPAAERVARMVRDWLGVHDDGPGPAGPKR